MPSASRRRLACFICTGLFIPADVCGQGYLISSVAGGAAYTSSRGNGGTAVNAYLSNPRAVAIDNDGNLYIADSGNNMIRKVDATTGLISTVAGNGAAALSGDGGAATSAGLNGPTGVAIDSAGNILIADTRNNRIRRVDAHGVIDTVAGSSSTTLRDGGPATSAGLNTPLGVACDSAGNFYIADYGNRRVRKVDVNGIITTVAGNGLTGSVGNVGDDKAAASAPVTPQAVALDGAGSLYIADSGNHLIRKVTGGIITTIAGTGNAGYTGDGSTATKATLQGPDGVAVDGASNVFIADASNNVIRQVSGGIVNTIAGNGSRGYSGDGGPAAAAALDTPTGVTVAPSGRVYIANSTLGTYQNARIRMLVPVNAAVPAILTNGVVPLFSTSTTISGGSWFSIYGSNFADSTALWNGDFPTQLNQVVVTVNSQPAYLWYVSPTQINAQAPLSSVTGTVTVAVATPGGTVTTTVSQNPYAPSLSLFNSKYPAAIVLTPGLPGNSGQGFDYIGPPGAFSFPSRPVIPGETVILYGVGFGPTQPVVRPGSAFSGVAYCETVPNVSIGSLQADVDFAGIVQAGLYQLNVVVPAAGSGDFILQVSDNGFAAQRNIYLTLQ